MTPPSRRARRLLFTALSVLSLRATSAARVQSIGCPVPPRRTGSWASSTIVVSSGHDASVPFDAAASESARQTGHASAAAYSGGSSPWS